MSDTNETDRMNERRRNMGLPPITARASKPTRQLTTEDIREYLEEIKAIAEKLFPNEIDRDAYIKNARSKVKEELLAEKVQLTDDDQILILDKITGKVKTTKIDNVKSKPTSKDFFKDKSQDLSNTSPEVLKLLDFIKNDKAKSNRDRILDNIRTGRNVERLEEVLSTTLESLLREQQTTVKLLNELKNKIAGSSATGGNNRNRGGIGSSILRGIASNPAIALLAGIGVARAVGSIISGEETEPSPSPQTEETVTRGEPQVQNPQEELNDELRYLVSEGQLTREQANNISIRSLTGEITLEEAREEARSLAPVSETVPPPPSSDNVPDATAAPAITPAAAPVPDATAAPAITPAAAPVPDATAAPAITPAATPAITTPVPDATAAPAITPAATPAITTPVPDATAAAAITPAAELTDSNLISSSALTSIADTNTQPVSLAKDPVTPNAATKNLNAPERNIAKDDDVIVNEAVGEALLLAREYESNPDLFSNRNLVLRAKKVTFSGDTIEFKLPSIDATSFQPSSPGAPNPLTIPASMPAPAGQALAKEPAMSATPAAISMGAAAGAASSTGLIRPTSGRVTSPFGMRSMGDHRGIDFGVPVGTPVVAAHSGTIVEVRESSSYGNMIRIRGDDGMDTLYAHLSTFGVQQGQQVTAGQQIALSGNTGRSTGPHLHFEVIRNGTKIDPAPLLSLSGAEAIQRPEGQTPEPSPSESDASPVASTPATAAASTTPSTEPTTPAAEMLSTPASDGAAVDGASRDNAMAERSPAPASAPNVIDMSGGSGNPSTPPPTYSSSPNDPGLVEPEDAAERYARLFDMAA